MLAVGVGNVYDVDVDVNVVVVVQLVFNGSAATTPMRAAAMMLEERIMDELDVERSGNVYFV